ncbi:hypothetical protein IWW38_001600, partial [Coemansia aciculifera]
MIEQHTPSSWSPSVASQYTTTMRVPAPFPPTLPKLAPAPQQQQPLQHAPHPQQMHMQPQMHVQRSDGMVPNSASQSNSNCGAGGSGGDSGFSAFQNYGLHVPFL